MKKKMIRLKNVLSGKWNTGTTQKNHTPGKEYI